MFEGFVRELILGYLGQFIKDIQTEQLKITLWNEEVLLENVELILEAFDYLKLPFALKQGRIGKLSIKIPWKKLGWDPVIIVLEDVFLCVCQRDDRDWCGDVVERREFASKKAQLAAAELSKFSKRVCASQNGRSFKSYITAKILDNIQVSVRNFHVLYHDASSTKGEVLFGLMFSSLTIMKKIPNGSSVAKTRGAQVNKVIEIQSLELYCSSVKEIDGSHSETSGDFRHNISGRFKDDNYCSMLAPLNVFLSLSVNRSGKPLNDAPQHTLNVEFSRMAMSVNEFQLQQIFFLCDYVSLCQLREKYGRFRPWWSPLEKRLKGWQRAWWHYAQESVLFDVRWKLRKTSWKYFGDRLKSRRKYVNLYKSKLRSLRHDQVIEEDIRHALEEMEKQTDIDDILHYRSVAERELKDFLVNSSLNRGWLNWLSYGMLGAGGTDDSSQFSGVISDDIIKDIFEATKFHPTPAPKGNFAVMDGIYSTYIKVNIIEICALLQITELRQHFADMRLKGLAIEGKVWEKSATITASIGSAQMLNPFNSREVLSMKKVDSLFSDLEMPQPSIYIQVDRSPSICDINLSVKVTINPVELCCDPEFIKNVMEFLYSFKCHSFQHERILISINGIDDLNTRLSSKISYILSSHKKTMWDIKIFNLEVIMPWEAENLEEHKMVVKAAAVSFASRAEIDFFGSEGDGLHLRKRFLYPDFGSIEEIFLGFRLLDLYNLFEIQINEIEMKLATPSTTVPLLSNFHASTRLASCIISDEPILKALEINAQVPSVTAHFSVTTYVVCLGLIEQFKLHITSSHSTTTVDLKSNVTEFSRNWLSINVNINSLFLLADLEDDLADVCTMKLFCQALDLRYDRRDFSEGWTCVKSFKLTAKSSIDDCETNVFSSSGILHGTESVSLYLDSQNGPWGDENSIFEGHFLLHFLDCRNAGKCVVCASDLDIHCYPFLFGRLIKFFDTIASIETSGSVSWDSASSFNHSPFNPEDGPRNFSNVENEVASKFLSVKQKKEQEKLHVYEETKICSIPEMENEIDVDSTLRNSDNCDLLPINLNLVRMTLHFHDSSCIIGTLTVPLANVVVSNSSDLLDITCSTEGVSLSSLWWSQLINEFLWGPLSSNLSSVLNFHLTKKNTGSQKFLLEMRFYIKKVSCMLPPDYLAMIIGYFSLPDWCFNAKKQTTNGMDYGNIISVVYKFEIVDCNVLTHSSGDFSEFVKLNISQLNIIFSDNHHGSFTIQDIPSECYVNDGKISDRNNTLDISGCDLSLMVLSFENVIIDSQRKYRNVPFITSFSANVWVTIPCDTELLDVSPFPTCIMAMIYDCQLHVEDEDTILGLEALGYVIDQFSLVGLESRFFTSDVPHFQQMLKQLIETGTLLPEMSDLTLIEMRFSVRSLSIKLYNFKRDLAYSELILEADTCLVCSISLTNGKLQHFDMSCSSLVLYSFFSSVVLAELSCPGSSLTVLNFIMSISSSDEIHLFVSIPCLDMWLYWVDWDEVIDLLKSCSARLSKEPISHTSTETQSYIPNDTDGYVVASESNVGESENTIQLGGFSTLTLDNVGLAVHFPALISSESKKSFSSSHAWNKQSLGDQSRVLPGNRNCFLSINWQCRSIDVINGKIVSLTISSESVSGILKLSVGNNTQTWPFFQLSKVHLELELSKYDIENLLLKILVQCDSVNISVSDKLFYLTQFTWFTKSDETPSQFSIKRMNIEVQLRKFSLLLTDWKRTSSGPLLEILVRNSLLFSTVSDDETKGSIVGEFQVNYYNIDKVLWEPFVEPWKFRLSMIRKHDERSLLSDAIMTDINLESESHLNLNINELLIEVFWRVLEMIRDSQGLMKIIGNQEFSNSQILKDPVSRRYAPYMLQNLTTIPLSFYVCLGADEFDVSPSKGVVQPGSSTLIYINESPEKLLFRYRPSQSYDRLNDKQLLDAAHRYMTFQLDGTFVPSAPISMDLVGRRYFDVDFSKSSKSEVYVDEISMNKFKAVSGSDSTKGFIIPVVIDVSMQRYTKLIRLYSTVIILNATPVSLEVRFDIPFGVSPKISGPIFPGQEYPLPLHLAESGSIRWRPLGDSYLWSEPYSVSTIISNGFLRSFVCYPSHPRYDAFRCCISVQNQSLPPIGRLRDYSIDFDIDQKFLNCHSKSSSHLFPSKNRFLYQVMLTSPLVLKNYLEKPVSLTIDDTGITRSSILSEVESSFFHIDSSHDLSVTFRMHGFRQSVMKFPRSESFSTVAKFSGTKFSVTEIVRFDPEFSDGPLYVTMEKIMDAFTGAREIILSVPFLLYNCTGFPLVLSNSINETKGYCCIPSTYNLDDPNLLIKKKDGFGLISSIEDTPATGSTTKMHLNLPNSGENDSRKVTACLFSPDPNSYSGEIMVKLGRYLPSVLETFPKCSWSAPFSLIPPTGFTGVLVPEPSSSSGYVVSVCAAAAPFYGRTKVVAFQPRYVIVNACTKCLCYKQKGTDFHFILEAGQHSYIKWTDITRELFLSVRFDKPGWEWSGCFLPEQLGDTRVKVRNYISNSVSMMHVEVRCADIANGEEQIVRSNSGNSDTNLIILSEDDTGFMPYRIDNISRERLRVYQPKCESFETVIHPYTSLPYAWDEPCCTHSLIIEVPGERILGSFAIDNPLVDSIVHLSANLEKPERHLQISGRSEGAIKVLSIIDSSYHVLKNLRVTHLEDNSKQTQKQESFPAFKERLSVDIPFLGVSLMNSHPEELLFASVKNTTVSFVQSVDQQQFFLQIASLQFDNQLVTSPYPVILSFSHGNRGNIVNQIRSKENRPNILGGNTTQIAPMPVFSLAISKWRTSETTMVSFESVLVRISDLHLDIEQEIVLRLFEFFKTASSRLQSRIFESIDSSGHTLFPDLKVNEEISRYFENSVSFDEKHYTFSSITLPNKRYPNLLPQMVPIGAPWQKIHLSAQKQKKIYVEHFDISAINLTFSFSSSPWVLRQGVLTSGDSLIHRGLMALADVEGAKIHFKHLVLSHQIASWQSFQEILVSHYTHQFLHEMYKVFGSAGVIGNPMGFARSLGLGIKDFFSLPIWTVFQNPTGLVTGVTQGTTSLFSNTVYAISDATSQFSKAAHKGIVAFTFEDQFANVMEKSQKGIAPHNKGVINEFLQGLTGMLQSPIKGAEKYGLPGVFSGIAVGVTGLVARPAASILEVTGKTAQSIRNRSRIHHMGYRNFRFRLPRPLSRELPLKPFSWEEAVGRHALSQRNKETLVMCKALKERGQYALITARILVIVSSACLVDVGKPEFEGVPADPKWVTESEIRLDSIILADNDGKVVHIVGSGSDSSFRHNQHKQKRGGNGASGNLWNHFQTPLPLLQTNLVFMSSEEANEFLEVLRSVIDRGKERGWDNILVLHRSSIK